MTNITFVYATKYFAQNRIFMANGSFAYIYESTLFNLKLDDGF